MPEAIQERARSRLRAAMEVEDARAQALQKELRLEGTWNVSPEDLVTSRRRGLGSVLATFRRAIRPVRKLFANLELPLYKQSKINLGIAETLDELLCRTIEIQGRFEDLTRRLEELEAREGAAASVDPESR